MSTRKQYDRVFKLDAISLVLEQGYTQAAAARSLGVSTTALNRWLKTYYEDAQTAFRGNGNLTPEKAELRHLLRENRQLKMERDILKKGLTQITSHYTL